MQPESRHCIALFSEERIPGVVLLTVNMYDHSWNRDDKINRCGFFEVML